MIIFLALLPALALSANNESVIDWTKCGKQARCFCLDAANPGIMMPHKHMEGTPDEKKKSLEKCSKIGAQILSFTEDTALLQMQILGEDAENLGEEPKIMFMRDGKETFGCEWDKEKKEVVLKADASLIRDFKLELFEKRYRFAKGNVICAVKMNRLYQYAEFLKQKRSEGDTIVKLIGANPVQYELYTSGRLFFKETEEMKCNPFLFKEMSVSHQYHMRPVINRDRDVLNCENYETETISYTMRYDKSSNQGVPITALMCENDAKTGYAYKIITDTNEMDASNGTNTTSYETLTNPESYSIYCAANIGETCADPNPDCKAETDSTCPKYNAGGKIKGKPSTLECDGRKWLINGSFLELAANPVCKPTSTNNGAAFFATLPSGYDVPVKGARCFSDYDCAKKSYLDLPVCNNETLCGGIDTSDPMVLKCKNEKRDLSIYSAEFNRTLDQPSYKCNTSSGSWYNGDVVVPAGSQVSCDDNTGSHLKPEASMSDELVNSIIAGVFVFIIIVIVAVGLGVYCCIKRRNKHEFKQKKEWLELQVAERIARTKEDFDLVLRATGETAHLILEGLKMVEMLLDTETEDLSVWEEAYKFLMRFQGTIVRIDYKIWHMFNRYLHMQAKAIIDKHGWLTKKRITKATPNGLIRVVAIRLLSFTLNDPFNHETEELLWLGFRALGFRGFVQYPHCGVLWWTLLHTRPGVFQRKNDKSCLINFDPPQFFQTLREIALQAKIVIPPEDIIPQFGSLAQQAAYALGGAPSTRYHVLNFKNVVRTKTNSEGGEVPKSYFAGMGESLTRNPVQTILDACSMWPKPNPELLEEMHAVAPEAEWNSIVQRAVKIVFYYGRSLDAKRLQVRFIANPDEDEYGKLNHEQQQFEAAMEKAKEDLRSWLAARTDKEELKHKPVYITDGKVKLDNSIMQAPQPVAAAAASAPSSAAPTSGPPSSDAATPVAAATPTTPAAAAPPTGGSSKRPAAATTTSSAPPSSDRPAAAAATPAAAAATPTTPAAAQLPTSGSSKRPAAATTPSSAPPSSDHPAAAPSSAPPSS